MTAASMPGLAGLIDHHKKKSHVLKAVLDKSLANLSKTKTNAETCPNLQAAISQLRPDQMRKKAIPEAIEELREIRDMIEGSTDLIMSKTENLMELEPALDDAMEILQACSFQDIVGQRLSKVTELLETLEERFHSLVQETGVEDSLDSLGEDELEAERRRKELILHGPQFTGEGVSQDEIDALLGA